MKSAQFEGSKEIGKPLDMLEAECSSVWAQLATCPHTFMPCVYEAYIPSEGDKKAIMEGRPIWIQILTPFVPPIAIWTMDENDKVNEP